MVTGFFIFVAIVTITAILFGGWLIVSVVRLMASAATALFAPPRVTNMNSTLAAPDAVRCSNAGCLQHNPADARFCRRCGFGLPAAHRVQVRRAAVW